MSTNERVRSPEVKDLESLKDEGDGFNDDQQISGFLKKVHKECITLSKARLGKNDSRYWRTRIFKPEVRGRESPHYAMQAQVSGRRVTLTLNTANKDAAAAKAARVYSDLVTLGVESALAVHRPDSVKQTEPEPQKGGTTVGDWITAARAVSVANVATFSQYCASLRLIAGQIVGTKKSATRFGGRAGGAASYRAEIDAVPLSVLSPTALQQWRIAYVAQAQNPAQERSRMTSCNSTIRQARSLFAKKITKHLSHLKVEPMPFADVELFPRQNAKYFSRMDATNILAKASATLRATDPPAFLAMLLALTAGLRRGEIDALTWGQIDEKKSLIRVEQTETASLKSEGSAAEVHLSEDVTAVLSAMRPRRTKVDDFVIVGDGHKFGPRVYGRHYRCQAVFDRLFVWLRAHGVKAKKPLHELRKELGALVTAEHGIYAASRVLRHADVATTARHYVDLKDKPVISFAAALTPSKPKKTKAGKKGGKK